MNGKRRLSAVAMINVLMCWAAVACSLAGVWSPETERKGAFIASFICLSYLAILFERER